MARDKKKIREFARTNPNTYFFGNFVDADLGLEFFDAFRRDILRFSKRSSRNIKQKEFSEKEESLKAIAVNRIDLHTRLYTQVVCESFLISCVIFLEQQIKYFTDGLMFALPIRMKLTDLRGTLIKRFRMYCQDLAGLELDFSDN